MYTQATLRCRMQSFTERLVTSGMIEGMVNPFERIMRCIRLSVKLPLGEAYSLLFLAKPLYHRMTAWV